MKEVRHIFRPELLNRLDDIVAFKALSHNDLKEVTSRGMAGVRSDCRRLLLLSYSTSFALSQK